MNREVGRYKPFSIARQNVWQHIFFSISDKQWILESFNWRFGSSWVCIYHKWWKWLGFTLVSQLSIYHIIHAVEANEPISKGTYHLSRKSHFDFKYNRKSKITLLFFKVNHFPGSGIITNKASLVTVPLPAIPPAFQIPKDKNSFLQEVRICNIQLHMSIIFCWPVFRTIKLLKF